MAIEKIAHQLIIIAAALLALPCLAAQSPSLSPIAPPPAPDCFTYLLKLSDCLTFVEEGSNLTRPDSGCCPELSNLVDTQPRCLCQLLGNPGQVGISVDVKRALQLPVSCNVTTPPVSLCAAIGIPVGNLAPTEAPSPSPSPSAGGGQIAASPSPGGSMGNTGSSGNSLASAHYFLIGSLSAVFFTSFFF